VLGKILPPARDGVVTFNVTIPERYAFEVRDGVAGGTIDGEPLTGSYWLTAGLHELHLAEPADEVLIVWARAAERGISPFQYIHRIRNRST
jgi:hypothetical protein